MHEPNKFSNEIETIQKKEKKKRKEKRNPRAEKYN